MEPNLNPLPQQDPAPIAPTTPPAPQPTPEPIAPQPNPQPTTESRKGSSKRLFIFIGAGLALILGIFLIIKFFGGGGSEEAKKEVELINTTYDENILLAVKKDDKYGYINLKGEFVIEPQFYSASNFIGDYAVVRAGDDNKSSIIDRKGEIKLTNESKYDSYDYDAENGLWYDRTNVYDKKLKRLADDKILLEYEDGYIVWTDAEAKKAGIMNAKGKIVYTLPETNLAPNLSLDVSDNDANLPNTYCILKDYSAEKSTYSIINCATGKVIIEPRQGLISDEDNNLFELHNSEYKLERTIYIQDDKIVIDTPHEISMTHYGTYAQIYDYDASYDDRISYIVYGADTTQKDPPASADNKDASDIALSEWESATGLTIFSCNKGYGLMNGDKVSVACEYDSITPPDSILYKYLKKKGKDYIFATKDEKILIITSKGKQIAELNGTRLKLDDTSTFIYYTDNDSKQTILYNLLTNKSIAIEDKDVNSYINLYPLYATVRIGDKTTYFNKDLTAIYEFER